MSILFILNSGQQFTVKCEEFTLNRNGLGQITGYEINGISENKPLYVDFSQVAAIIRVQSDEADTD